MHKPCFRMLSAILTALLPILILPGCEPGQEEADPAKEKELSAREALAYAWPEAQRRDADARLAMLSSGRLDDDGRSGQWRITFYKAMDIKGLPLLDQITIVIEGGKITGTRKENPYSFRPDPDKAEVAWRVDSTEAAELARAHGAVLTGGRNSCIAFLYAPEREGVGVKAAHWTWELQTMQGTVVGTKYVVDATTADYLGPAGPPPEAGKASPDIPKRCGLGEKLEIIFRMRQYNEKVEVSAGRVWIRVNKWCRTGWNENNKSKFSLYQANLSIRGDSGNKGFPLNFEGNGPDLAPWYFIMDSAGRIYEEDLWLSERANRLPPRKLSEIPVQSATVNTLNLVFVLPKEISAPQLWVQWYGLDGNIETAVIELAGKQP